MSVTWDFCGKQLTVSSNGSWHILSASHGRLEVRKNFRTLASSNLPFKSFIVFPTSSTAKNVVVELYCPWALDKTVRLVKDVIEGHFAVMLAAVALSASRKMRVPYDITRPSVYLHSIPVACFRQYLKVEDIAFYHLLSENLSKDDRVALQRELMGNKLLSEARRNAHPLLGNCAFGITCDNDRARNEDGSNHVYIAFPALSNEQRLFRSSSDLAKDSVIQIGFQDLPDTVVLPFDLEMDITHPLEFTFLEKKYSMIWNERAKTITYASEQRGVFFTHRFADETFFGASRTSIEALFAILEKFIDKLEGSEKNVLLCNPYFIKELFNDLFGFRVQLSVPDELECRSYRAPDFPKVVIEELINYSLVRSIDPHFYRQVFERIYLGLSTRAPQLSTKTSAALAEIKNFFCAQFDDGTNKHDNALAYCGITSAQLLLHFAPEIRELFTRDVVLAIMQLYKAYQHSSDPQISDQYEKLLLIKPMQNGHITTFSLIKRGLEDLDPIQYRLPPNRPFTLTQAEAESEFCMQLEAPSPLLEAISSMALSKPEDLPFCQDRHQIDAIADGIERLIYPVACDSSHFANVHGYLPEAFLEEFERGMSSYLDSFEIVRNGVVQTHVVDFVKRIVRGAELLQPRFKHDLLDLKHFMAGISANTSIPFVDGKVTFRELVLRCLYEIQQQPAMSINSHLIVETVYMFLQMVGRSPKTTSPTPNDTALALLSRINVIGYEMPAIQALLSFLKHSCTTNEFPYVAQCLNIMRVRSSKYFIQLDDVSIWLRAISQKLKKEDPDIVTEEYFIVLPEPQSA